MNEAEKNGFVLWFYNVFCLLKAVNQCDCDRRYELVFWF